MKSVIFSPQNICMVCLHTKYTHASKERRLRAKDMSDCPPLLPIIHCCLTLVLFVATAVMIYILKTTSK